MSLRPPEGVLPPPGRRDLPPVPRLRALLGPSIILVGLSIGSGEFVLWPRLTAQFGFAVFWAAWIGVTIQFFLNMEIERYTLATGESAVVGFLRLSRVFGPVFLVCGTLPWIWPGWATGAGTLLSWQLGGNPVVYAVVGLVLCGAVLSLGPVVYRTVEVLQIVLVATIFAGLLYLFARLVSLEALGELARGAVRLGHVPDDIELPLLLGALAFAGAGGTVNLAQSNYIRDKGYGMGGLIGRITSPLTGKTERESVFGVVFEGTEEDLARLGGGGGRAPPGPPNERIWGCVGWLGWDHLPDCVRLHARFLRAVDHRVDVPVRGVTGVHHLDDRGRATRPALGRAGVGGRIRTPGSERAPHAPGPVPRARRRGQGAARRAGWGGGGIRRVLVASGLRRRRAV